MADARILWWPSICGNTSIVDAFWSDAVSWYSPSPDFTQCFQDTALVWASCGLLWICAPFYLVHLHNKRLSHSQRAFSIVNTLKIVLSILMMGCCIFQTINMIVNHIHYPPSRWLSQTVYFFTLLLASWLMRKEYVQGQHSSGLMFCFWLVLLLTNTIRLRTTLANARKDHASDMLENVVFYLFFCLIVLEFTLHILADTTALNSNKSLLKRDKDERIPLITKKKGGEMKKTLLEDEDESLDGSLAGKPPCPECEASFLSRITFSWLDGMLMQGYKRTLDVTRLWKLRWENRVVPNMEKFYACWKRSSRHKRDTNVAQGDNSWMCDSSLVMALFRCYGLDYSLLCVYEASYITLTFLRPTILDFLIDFVESEESYPWRGYLWAFLLFAISMMRTLVNQQSNYKKMLIELRMRSSLMSSIYRKTLKLSNSERQKYSIGQTLNFMAVDSLCVADGSTSLNNVWVTPLNIIVAMVMLWGYLGPASLAGLGVLILVMIINLSLGSKIKGLQVKQMQMKDKRLKLTNEVISGIRGLKMYAWEGAFQRRLKDIRDIEVGYIWKTVYFISGMAITTVGAPVLFTVSTFTAYILFSHDPQFSAQVAFVTLSLINPLVRPLSTLPKSTSSLIKAWVSTKRIEKLLNGRELDSDAVNHKHSENAIEIKQGNFSWSNGNGSTLQTLQNISLQIKRGTLTAVVGQVGSGKSSLLSAILGEIHKVSGTVNVEGSVAYIPQVAWIRSDTLQNNVLFGRPMLDKTYYQTLDDFALNPDLKILPNGDLTDIGERGINLSGGQKQRISLARAVYLDKDIYLMDDPLSAVDVHVGKHIFENVIGPKGCLKNKTRLLVTHGLTHLPKVDQIIVIKDGQISEQGTYEDLLQRNGVFSELIETYLNEPETDEEVLSSEGRVSELSGNEGMSESSSTSHDSGGPLLKRRKRKGHRRSHAVHGTNIEDSKELTKQWEKQKLIDQETSEVGAVNYKVFLVYLQSLGVCMSIMVILSTLTQIGVSLGSNIWLSKWSQDQKKFGPNNTMDPNLPGLRVGVYGALGCLSVLMLLSQFLMLGIAITTAACILHDKLLDSIVKSPMSFFDTTPTGRIMNRFSQDINTVDSRMYFTAKDTLHGLSGVMTTLIGISYGAPIFLAFIPVFAIFYCLIQRFYIMTANQIRRISNVRTSPICSYFDETIMGASSIRAYDLQVPFIQNADRLIDQMQEFKFPANALSRWLSIRLQFLGALIVLFSALYSVILRDYVSTGVVGLIMTYSLEITDKLAAFVKNTSDLENDIISVERLDEYCKLKSEAPWYLPDFCPPKTWPHSGQVTFCDYSTRYREGLDLVLQKISCDIEGGQKVGVVGRTGAGKSSLTLGLFRLIEPTAGKIIIDHLNTSSLGLYELRSKITIIPQDPLLFSGTLRFNLDPFEKYNDDELWRSLTLANLDEFVKGVATHLDYECGEGGSNLSVGQRQLLCLARALLRQTQILVLDEATAAVDLETDDVIQTTIRKEFQNSTVITIAHRINTVIDYDKIIVLEGGQIAEFDTPAKLLENHRGIFHKMCKQAGIL